MQTPPPTQLCSGFNEKCAMCWTEWKINFPILIFRVMVDFVLKFNRKLTNFKYKNDHLKTKNDQNRKIDFSFGSAHSASFMCIWQLLKFRTFFCRKTFYSWGYNSWVVGATSPTTPTEVMPLDPACFWIETLAILVSVRNRLA